MVGKQSSSSMANMPPWMIDSQMGADFFLTVVSHMGEGLCVTDGSGNVEFANQSAISLLNLPEDTAERPNLFDLVDVSESWRREIQGRVVERGVAMRGDDWQFIQNDGRKVDVAYTISLAPTSNEKTGLIVTLRDISHRKQLERRLVSRERELEMAQRQANLGSWDWDLVTDNVIWTPELFRIYGYEPHSVVPSFSLAIRHIHPDDRPEVEAIIQDAMTRQEPFKYTCRLLPRGGSERIIVVYGSMRVDEEGELVQMWGTAQDITEFQQMAEENDQTQRFSELLIDSSQSGIVAIDRELRFKVWNPMMERMTGFTEEELLNRTIQDCFPQILEHKHELDNLYQLIAGASLEPREMEYINKDTGERFDVNIVYGPLLSEMGDIIGGLIISRDVTAHKRTLKALDRSRARSEAIFKGAGLGILLIDTDRLILEANPAWEEISGFPIAALLNQDLATFLWPEDQDALREGLDELLSGKRPFLQQEMRGRTAMGEMVWLSGVFSRLNDEEGKPHRIVSIIEDISPRKEMEQELITVKRELARSREKERLFMAQELHDGPIQDLYATTYQLQALKRVIDGEKSARLVENVLQQFNQVNDTLRTICNDLRPPTLAAFGLSSAVRSHAERFQNLYPDLTISLDLAEDDLWLPEYVRLTLFRITQEMLSNIAKHAEATQVVIRFELNRSDLVLEIQDNGNGFEVPDRWIELVREGHLGLLGASERAEEIDGSLTILSTPGSGTIVRVTAPRPDEEPNERSVA